MQFLLVSLFLILILTSSFVSAYGFETQGVPQTSLKIPHGFGQPIHQDITRDGLSFLNSNILKTIVDQHVIIEQDQSSPNHFDNCQFTETIQKINTNYVSAVAMLNPNHPDNTRAAEIFGQIVHPAQDFYSHSNWVEIGRTDLIDPYIGPWDVLHGYTDSSNNNPVFVLEEDGRNHSDYAITKIGKTIHVSNKNWNSVKQGLISGTFPADVNKCPEKASIPHGGMLLDRFAQDESIDDVNALNKDNPANFGFGSARILAVAQTTHEFCRLAYLVKDTWHQQGVNALYRNWVSNKNQANIECPGIARYNTTSTIAPGAFNSTLPFIPYAQNYTKDLHPYNDDPNLSHVYQNSKNYVTTDNVNHTKASKSKSKILTEDIKSLYRTTKQYEFAASLLLTINDDQDKIIKSITSNGWTKNKDPKIIPHAKVIEIEQKQQEIDKKNVQSVLSGIKEVSDKIKKQAQKQGISASEIEKIGKSQKKNGTIGKITPVNRLKDDAKNAKTLEDAADKDKESPIQSIRQISEILATELDNKSLVEKFRIHGYVAKEDVDSLLQDHKNELTESEIRDLEDVKNGIYGNHPIYHLDPDGSTWTPNEPSDEERTQHILDLMQQAIDLLNQEEQQQTDSILKQIDDPSLKDMFANPDNPPQTTTKNAPQGAQHTTTQVRPANDKPKTEASSAIRIQSSHGSTETSDSTITNSKRHDLLATWVIAPQRGKEYHTAVIRITNPDGTTTDVNAAIEDGVIQLRQQIYNIGKYTLNIISVDGNAAPANNSIEITVSRNQVRDSVPQTPPNVPPTPTLPSTPVTPVKTNSKPTLTIPRQITQEATGPSGASVVYPVTAQDKEDGPLLPSCNPGPDYTFPIGTTTVMCSATDSDGNTTSGTFTVTVTDTLGPVIGPITPHEGARDDSGVVISYTVTAVDAVDGPVAPTCNYPSGYKFPIGTTILTCTAVDSKGHQTSRSLQITVTLKQTGQ